MNKDERGFKGIWIPAEIWLAKELQLCDKAILVEIDSLSKTDRGCFASNEYFGKFINRSADTAANVITKLKKLGLVEQDGFNGRRRYLKISESASEKMQSLSRRILSPHNIINTETNTDINVSKDTYIDSKESNNGCFGKRCINVWNEFSFVQHHKSEKVIKEVDDRMKELIEGSFAKDKSFDTEYFRRNRISPTKQYSKKELLEGVKNVALFLKKGYPPESKRNIPRDLPSLIYNSRKGTSMFLSSLTSPPLPLSEKRFIRDSYPQSTNYFINNLFKGEMSDNDRAKLIRGIKSIEEFRRQIPKASLDVPKIRGTFSDMLGVCWAYTEWLEEQDWIEEIVVGMISAEGKMFSKFIKECEEDYCGHQLQ